MGRHKKAAKVDMRSRILGPSDAKVLAANEKHYDTIQTGGMIADTIPNRMVELGERIDTLVKVVKATNGGEVNLKHPWLTNKTPVEMVLETERRLFLSERVVAGLVDELFQQMMVSAELKSMLTMARERLVEGDPSMPDGLLIFAKKLFDQGLLARNVKGMSRKSLAAVVALLNGDVESAVLDAVGIGRTARNISDSEAEDAFNEAGRIMVENGQAMDALIIDTTDMVIEPVVPDWFEAEWKYEDGPLPPEYWSTVQTLDIPYEWEYRLVGDDEIDRIIGMELPEAHSWDALTKWDTTFNDLALNPIRNKMTAASSIQEILALKLNVELDDVDKNQIKVWLLMLAGRLMTQMECDRMFGEGYFEGIVMPCPATGPGVVRQLVRREG